MDLLNFSDRYEAQRKTMANFLITEIKQAEANKRLRAHLDEPRKDGSHFTAHVSILDEDGTVRTHFEWWVANERDLGSFYVASVGDIFGCGLTKEEAEEISVTIERILPELYKNDELASTPTA